MTKRIYFDTVAFRAIGRSLEKHVISSDLKSAILVSPLTIFELWSQLTIRRAEDVEDVFQQIQSLPNWTNPRTGLLPWPDDAVYAFWHQKLPPDDGFTKKMERGFNLCLNATSPDQLSVAAGGLKDAMDDVKQKMAIEFKKMLELARKQGLKSNDFSTNWFQGIAKRAKGNPSSRSFSEVSAALSAYLEFEMSKLHTALVHKDYNPEKHKNDVFDAEQLVYLYDPSLHFLTCDGGFTNLVKQSAQAKRIVHVTQDKISNAAQVEALLRNLIS